LKCAAGEGWADRVRNEKVSQRVNEEGSLKKYKEVKLTGLVIFLCKCHLKHFIEGKIQGRDISDEKTRKKT
jgi:hypothetical protein